MTDFTNKDIEFGWVSGENGWGDGMNENLQRVSNLLLCTVISATTTAPPGSPTDGDGYLVPTGATGVWVGHEGELAYWSALEGDWLYFTPLRGWQVTSQATDLTYYYTGSAWQGLYARVANGIQLPGSALKLGTDASGTDAAATSVTQTAPLSTGNATPAALVWQVGAVGASGSTPQTATEILRLRGSVGSATIGEMVANGFATLRLIPGATQFAIRNSGNTADTFTINAAGTAITAPLANSFVVGADIGSSDFMRVNGRIRAASGFVSNSTFGMFRNSDSSSIVFGGGQNSAGGANVTLYGGSHATQANDIEFRSGTTVRGWWDDSAALWEFSNAASTLTRFSTPAAGETSLWLYDADNATLERVTVGAADSGGVGYKVLRIPN